MPTIHTSPHASMTPAAADEFLAGVAEARRAYPLPHRLRSLAEEFAQGVLALLFPQFAGESGCDPHAVAAEAKRLRDPLGRVLSSLVIAGGRDPEGTGSMLFAHLPAIRAALVEDAQATLDGDPAAESLDVVILAYPGFYATAVHRLAHPLYEAGVPLFPRLLAEFAHRMTGIDIHPGARIGRAFSIDHGTGVVIGETAVLGDRVRLFQGVTLGALMVRKGLARTKRHPTIGDDVVVYSNATILGGDTLVGSGTVVGGNVWLTHSVPPKSVVTYSKRVEATHADYPLDYQI